MTAQSSGELVLVSGGFHSGKSKFALNFAEERGKAGLYVATLPLSDTETMDRVAVQREERERRGWSTLEVETDLLSALNQAAPGQTVLVDCLTYWINRILLDAVREEVVPNEDALARLAEQFADQARARPGLTIAVTNELGLGIAPNNDLARQFRVLIGRVNEVVATKADSVYFIVSGLQVKIK